LQPGFGVSSNIVHHHAAAFATNPIWQVPFGPTIGSPAVEDRSHSLAHNKDEEHESHDENAFDWKLDDGISDSDNSPTVPHHTEPLQQHFNQPQGAPASEAKAGWTTTATPKAQTPSPQPHSPAAPQPQLQSQLPQTVSQSQQQSSKHTPSLREIQEEELKQLQHAKAQQQQQQAQQQSQQQPQPQQRTPPAKQPTSSSPASWKNTDKPPVDQPVPLSLREILQLEEQQRLQQEQLLQQQRQKEAAVAKPAAPRWGVSGPPAAVTAPSSPPTWGSTSSAPSLREIQEQELKQTKQTSKQPHATTKQEDSSLSFLSWGSESKKSGVDAPSTQTKSQSQPQSQTPKKQSQQTQQAPAPAQSAWGVSAAQPALPVSSNATTPPVSSKYVPVACFVVGRQLSI
jgi:hypothetical protein